jgi:AraC-like DNA-binding protein
MASPPAAFDLPRGFLDEWASRDLRFDGTLRTLIASPDVGSGYADYDGARGTNLGINLVLRGSGRYVEASGREHALFPGALFHRFPRVPHETWFDPASGYTELYLVLDGATGSLLKQCGLIAADPVINVGVDPVILQSYRHLVKRIREPEARVPARLLLVEVIAFVNDLYLRARRNRVLPFWERVVEDACQLLEQNLDERMHAETVARRLGVTYAAFRKRFKAATGFSPVEYRIRRRLESAQHSLMVRSVTATAREYGYPDPYTFSTQFRKHVGLSPRRFQERMRDGLVLVPLVKPRPESPPG